jgi:hypothetical protein
VLRTLAGSMRTRRPGAAARRGSRPHRPSEGSQHERRFAVQEPRRGGPHRPCEGRNGLRRYPLRTGWRAAVLIVPGRLGACGARRTGERPRPRPHSGSAQLILRPSGDTSGSFGGEGFVGAGGVVEGEGRPAVGLDVGEAGAEGDGDGDRSGEEGGVPSGAGGGRQGSVSPCMADLLDDRGVGLRVFVRGPVCFRRKSRRLPIPCSRQAARTGWTKSEPRFCKSMASAARDGSPPSMASIVPLRRTGSVVNTAFLAGPRDSAEGSL